VLLVVEAAVMVVHLGLPFWPVARCNGSRPVPLRSGEEHRNGFSWW
jgi:hypothetical protein